MNPITMPKQQEQLSGFAETGPDEGAAIHYTQTRVHTVNEQALSANRLISIRQPGVWLESYRMLRTRVLQTFDAMNWRTLAITSTGNGAGNSLTAANLAISISMELNRTALLVDANFKNPSIHKLFGFTAERGLSDYLLDDVELSSLLVNPNIQRLVILPAGQPMVNSTEMLHSPKMQHLVTELKTRYPSRIIIFDMPPVLSQDDALAFSPYVDSVLLVIDEGGAKIDDLRRVANLFKENRLLGSVFNKVTDNKIMMEN
ncbi:MAG: CpsD/CapB family tyrosine-protein kinase [Methylomonas sp.]